MSQSRRMRALAAGVALAGGFTVLGGCGDNGTTSVKTDHGKVSVDADKGEVSVPADEGTVAAGQAIPDGFPKGDVPLLDAKVVTGARGATGDRFAWSVVMQTSRAVEDVTAEVKKDYAAAGYKTRQANEMGDVTVLQFASAKYDVSVTAARTGESITVTYLVKEPS